MSDAGNLRDHCTSEGDNGRKREVREEPPEKETDAERRGKPPYPADVLIQFGAHLFSSKNPAELHPCERSDLCGGKDCKWKYYPKNTCWDFARFGFCGRAFCRRIHAVSSMTGDVFCMSNKRLKLNQQMSRSEAREVAMNKRQRAEEVLKQEEAKVERKLALATRVVQTELALQQAKVLAELSSEQRSQRADFLLGALLKE